MQVCPGCGVAHAAPAGGDAVSGLHSLGASAMASLAQLHIHSVADLAALGAVDAFLRIETLRLAAAQPKPSLNLLYGLEAAISGMHWLQVKRMHQLRLLSMLEQARVGAASPTTMLASIAPSQVLVGVGGAP